jgi:glyoxylase-like metal-dependent hydrolase (beta-lactamase superfamily II)
MLKQVANGVYVHESEFLQSNSTAIVGEEGVLLIDPGITAGEMAVIADDIRDLGQTVVAGFSTHPDWDHVLWHENFGDAPRYGTARGAASMRDLLSNPQWESLVTEILPPEYADDIPKDLLGRIAGLPPGAARVPWDGPATHILEHRAHADGHAALLLDERRVLVAGDMLSDILIPFLDLDAADPIGDYLAALDLFERITGQVDVVIPGHGSVASAEQLGARIEQDRAYLHAVRDGIAVKNDPRVSPPPPLDWLADVHDWQLGRLADKRDRSEAST